MIHTHELNVALLRTIEDELTAAIQHASLAFENYLAEAEQAQNLDDCWQALNQMRGALKLIQFHGALELAEAMQDLIERMKASSNPVPQRSLEALSDAFILLPCFIEYSISHKQSIPILLENMINQLRACCQHALLAETQFADFSYQEQAELPVQNLTQPEESLDSVIRRLRHMYQVGLVAIAKSGYSEKQAQLLARAIDRIRPYVAESKVAELFWLASIVVNALANGDLSGSLGRTRLLAQIDRVLRNLATDSAHALSQPIDESLKTQLLFLVALAKADNEDYLVVTSHYQLPECSITDGGLRQLREQMQGPNSKTIQSMVDAVKEELLMIKDTLEIAAQDVQASDAEMNRVEETLQRLTEIFKVVDLSGPAQTLIEIGEKIRSWRESDAEIGANDLIDLADSLLFVESSLSTLGNTGISTQALSNASELSRQNIIANSHLADAEYAVLQEAQSGIALAKRAISSYMESNYEQAHIANVGTTLHSVKGGLAVVKLSRASAVLDACIEFVSKELQNISSESEARTQELLATLADALIATEYYLDEVMSHRDADDNVLGVAEESLEALGYPVVPA